MTREEIEKAIRVLDDIKVKIDIPKAAVIQNNKNWALDMAIKALEQEPILDKIRAEIEKQEKWLLQAGYNQYNVDIVFSTIKSLLKESEG